LETYIGAHIGHDEITDVLPERTGFEVFDFDSQVFHSFLKEFPVESEQACADVPVEQQISAFEEFDSRLLKAMIQKECSLDDLKVKPKAEKTYKGTFTAVRSFNRFWATHPFNPLTEDLVCQLRDKYSTADDGFHALCLAEHSERNIMLSHYVAKVLPYDKTNKKEFVTGGSKRIYLVAIQRALKLFEKQHKLIAKYGRHWCWSTDEEYEQLRSVLDISIIENEFDKVQDKASEIMSLEQFQALHEKTWELANDMTLSFPERLKHRLRYLMQGTVAFGCLRAREDLAECRTDEFTPV
jgi:hypothetical protein